MGSRAQTMGELGKAGAAVTIAASAANLLAYLVPLLAARTLVAADVGAVAAIMAILAIAGVPGLGLQLAVAVATARHNAVDRLHQLTMVTAAATVIPLILLTPLLSSALDLPWPTVPLTALIAGLVIVGSGRVGVLQGSMRFTRLALGLALIGVARCGGIIIGLLMGLPLTGVLLLGVVVAALSVAPLLRIGAPAGDTPELKRDLWAATSATLAFFLLSYADLIAARYLLPPAMSGEYAVLSVLTKGAIWAPQTIAIIALPYFARNVRWTRTIAAGSVLAVGGVLVLASFLFGNFALQLAGGPSYTHLAGYAPAFAAIGSLYALVLVLTNSQLAAGAKTPSAPLWLGFAGFTIAVLTVAEPTISGIVTCALITAAASAAALVLAISRRAKIVVPTGVETSAASTPEGTMIKLQDHLAAQGDQPDDGRRLAGPARRLD